MREKLLRVQRALSAMALVAVAALFGALAVCGQLVTSQLTTSGGLSENTVLVPNALLLNLVLTLALGVGLWLVSAALRRFARVRLTGVLAALWLIGTLAFLLGAQTQQIYDFEYVMEGARLFARGNYKMMSMDYFNAYGYQLGFCLPMEILLRVMPSLDINLFMQATNVLLSVAAAGVLVALCEVLAGRRTRYAAAALYLTFLPGMLYCSFVYATMPMIFLCACAFLCFALYLQRRRVGLAAVAGVCVAVAVMLKPNAYVPLLSLLICALVDGLTSRDLKLLACLLLGTALAVLLARAAIWQYELRSGVRIAPEISAAARLSMGLQRENAQAGWYNRYFERFYPLDVTMEQEHAIAMADVSARLAEFRADPAMAAAFVRDKMLSQWLEPTYGTMWYGNLCEQTGPLAGMARLVYAQGSGLRAALERYMAVWQQALYALAAVGTASALCRRGNAAQLMLPVAILGGFLYHMIFEAKSQYIYVYAFYAIPMAAQGLCALEDAARRALAMRGGKKGV